MTLTWRMTDESDLVISSGTLSVVTGSEEVRQRVLIALRHYWQEYFLNVPAGLPWYEFILGSKDKQTVDALLRAAILAVPGVDSIVNFQVVYPSNSTPRQLEVYADIETIYGIISVQSTGGV